jgi:hypothetical protein
VKKKVKPIVGMQRESMILALSMDELVAGLNLAMRVRKLTFTLDYSQDHFPRLYIEMPGIEKQQIMLLDQRKHCCYIMPPSNRELFFAFNDITTRLHNSGGRLSLTGDRPKQGPMRALLQIYVDGATNIALTLMDTTKGKKKTDTDFQLPDGTTP